MIGNQVPNHLVIGARTGFLTALRERQYLWQRVASQLNMSAKSETLVDLGAAPMPTESKSGITVQDFIEKTLTAKPIDWDITVFISHNAMMDDQTGTLDQRVRSAGNNFQKHIDKLVFQTLNGGDGATYGLCYDGQYFFDTDHVDKGGAYQTNQSNKGALALSIDNFETAYVAAKNFLDDQGEYAAYNHDLLVVPPAYDRIAAQITSNPQAYDTANRETNPYNGKVSSITVPYLDSTASILVASNEPVKPCIVVMREQPNLQATWVDPKAPDGGRYYFKFFARYNVVYGDWRLAYMIHT